MVEKLRLLDIETLKKYLVSIDFWIKMEPLFFEQSSEREQFSDFLDEIISEIPENVFDEIASARSSAIIYIVNRYKNNDYLKYLMEYDYYTLDEIINELDSERINYIIEHAKTIQEYNLERHDLDDKCIIDYLSNDNILKHYAEIKKAIIEGRYTNYIENEQMRKIMNTDLEVATISIKKSFESIDESILMQIPKKEIIDAIRNGSKIDINTSDYIFNTPEYIKEAIKINPKISNLLEPDDDIKNVLIEIVSENSKILKDINIKILEKYPEIIKVALSSGYAMYRLQDKTSPEFIIANTPKLYNYISEKKI